MYLFANRFVSRICLLLLTFTIIIALAEPKTESASKAKEELLKELKSVTTEVNSEREALDACQQETKALDHELNITRSQASGFLKETKKAFKANKKLHAQKNSYKKMMADLNARGQQLESGDFSACPAESHTGPSCDTEVKVCEQVQDNLKRMIRKIKGIPDEPPPDIGCENLLNSKSFCDKTIEEVSAEARLCRAQELNWLRRNHLTKNKLKKCQENATVAASQKDNCENELQEITKVKIPAAKEDTHKTENIQIRHFLQKQDFIVHRLAMSGKVYTANTKLKEAKEKFHSVNAHYFHCLTSSDKKEVEALKKTLKLARDEAEYEEDELEACEEARDNCTDEKSQWDMYYGVLKTVKQQQDDELTNAQNDYNSKIGGLSRETQTLRKYFGTSAIVMLLIASLELYGLLARYISDIPKPETRKEGKRAAKEKKKNK